MEPEPTTSRDVPPAPSSDRCLSRSGRAATRRAFPFTAAPPSCSRRTSPGRVSLPSPWMTQLWIVRRHRPPRCPVAWCLSLRFPHKCRHSLARRPPPHQPVARRLPLRRPVTRHLPLRWPVTRGVPPCRRVALRQPHRHATRHRRAAGGRARRDQGVKKHPAGARGTGDANCQSSRRRREQASRAGTTVRRHPCITDIRGGAGEQGGPGHR